MINQSTHPSIHQSFVASGRCIEPDAPACDGRPTESELENATTLDTGVDTHTETDI